MKPIQLQLFDLKPRKTELRALVLWRMYGFEMRQKARNERRRKARLHRRYLS